MPRLQAAGILLAASLLAVACGADGDAGTDVRTAGDGVGTASSRSSSSTQVSSSSAARTASTTAAPSQTTSGAVSSTADGGASTVTALVVTTAPRATDPTTDTTPDGAEPTTTVASSTTEEVELAIGGGTGPSVAPAAARDLGVQDWVVFASFEGVDLVHPSIRIERIGFHESNNDGARQLVPSSAAVNPLVLESRNRGTGSRTAADIVVEPGTEIRAPVTGTVLRAGGYILYCEHNDDFVVIEPDARPGWEVKVLHIDGVRVSAGDRVEAGVTVLAPAATPLPFDSQVDDFTAEPSWPHVHLELVDPSIPDRPSPGGGC